MTSKERVLGALAHVEPDRVPIGYSANPEIDRRLKAHFGLDASDGGALSDALGVDFRGAFARYAGPNLHPAYGDRHVAVWGVRSRWIEPKSRLSVLAARLSPTRK